MIPLPPLAGAASLATLRFTDVREEAAFGRWHAARMARVDALACLAKGSLLALQGSLGVRWVVGCRRRSGVAGRVVVRCGGDGWARGPAYAALGGSAGWQPG